METIGWVLFTSLLSFVLGAGAGFRLALKGGRVE